MVGDSSSGKTFLSMTCFAEAVANRHFKDYRLIYDNIEDGMLMDVERLFNGAVADRIEPPRMDKEGRTQFSTSLEEFYFNLDDASAAGKPFIYILDSMDALIPEADDKKFDQQKKAFRKHQRREEGDATKADEKEEKVAGSYGMAKAKLNSSSLRKSLKGLRATDSILVILSQTRQNVGSMYGGKTRAGGEALRFYATAEVWSSIDEVLKKKVNNKDRQVGVRVELKVKKNRQTGKLFTVTTDIYPSYGIDDTGACVDYLVEEGWWEIQKLSIVAKEFDLTATRDKIINWIEENGKVGELRTIVGECWAEIDAKCSLSRMKRYGE
jgi:RecA/RadA recombinase